MRLYEVPHGTVVVGIDGSVHSRQAVDWAAGLARREHRPLVLVHSSDPFTFEQGGVWTGWGDWHELRRRADSPHGEIMTAELARTQATHPELEVHPVEDYVDPRLALTELSTHAYRVVVGSHGRGPVASALLGSVSAAVARDARCPTVVVRPDTARTGGVTRNGVTVVVDRSRPSPESMELAFRHASTTGQRVRVLLCRDDRDDLEDPSSPEQLRLELSELCAGLGEKFPDVTVQPEVEHGPMEDVAVGATVESDLTVIGRYPHHGRVGLARGRFTTTVLEHARGPVVIVPERKS
ncbi:universal stress protein [Nocardioides rubriscoriae]|uniref:universal stress protein n=1 Tax=Nocardioides rubriscoriae TaxID=642762 RepID=UPI00147848FD|nr:universal stress protein [Nocardioides rubriscoriae]